MNSATGRTQFLGVLCPTIDIVGFPEIPSKRWVTWWPPGTHLLPGAFPRARLLPPCSPCPGCRPRCRWNAQPCTGSAGRTRRAKSPPGSQNSPGAIGGSKGNNSKRFRDARTQKKMFHSVQKSFPEQSLYVEPKQRQLRLPETYTQESFVSLTTNIPWALKKGKMTNGWAWMRVKVFLPSFVSSQFHCTSSEPWKHSLEHLGHREDTLNHFTMFPHSRSRYGNERWQQRSLTTFCKFVDLRKCVLTLIKGYIKTEVKMRYFKISPPKTHLEASKCFRFPRPGSVPITLVNLPKITYQHWASPVGKPVSHRTSTSMFWMKDLWFATLLAQILTRILSLTSSYSCQHRAGRDRWGSLAPTAYLQLISTIWSVTSTF